MSAFGAVLRAYESTDVVRVAVLLVDAEGAGQLPLSPQDLAQRWAARWPRYRALGTTDAVPARVARALAQLRAAGVVTGSARLSSRPEGGVALARGDLARLFAGRVRLLVERDTRLEPPARREQLPADAPELDALRAVLRGAGP